MPRTSAHSETRRDPKCESTARGLGGAEHGAGLLSGITDDANLTPDERWLMIEALFVQDAAGPSLPASYAPENMAAAWRALAPRRKRHEGLPAEVVSDAALGAGLDGAPVARAR